MSARLLPRPQSLGDPTAGGVRDVELFCRDAMRRGLRMCGGRLEGQSKIDALSHLIGEAIELFDDYDPALNSSFSKYAYPILPLRLVDWYRSEFGDTRYAPRPTLDEYNDELAQIVDHSTSLDEVLTKALFARRLESSHGAIAG